MLCLLSLQRITNILEQEALAFELTYLSSKTALVLFLSSLYAYDPMKAPFSISFVPGDP